MSVPINLDLQSDLKFLRLLINSLSFKYLHRLKWFEKEILICVFESKEKGRPEILSLERLQITTFTKHYDDQIKQNLTNRTCVPGGALPT